MGSVLCVERAWARGDETSFKSGCLLIRGLPGFVVFYAVAGVYHDRDLG